MTLSEPIARIVIRQVHRLAIPKIDDLVKSRKVKIAHLYYQQVRCPQMAKK